MVAPAFTVTFVSPRASTVDCFVVNETTIVNVAALSLEFVTVPPADQPDPVAAQSFIDTDGRAFGSLTIVSAFGAATCEAGFTADPPADELPFARRRTVRAAGEGEGGQAECRDSDGRAAAGLRLSGWSC